VSMSGITIQHGLADRGGGVFNNGGRGSLFLGVVTQNQAAGIAGGPGIFWIAGGGRGGPGRNGGDGEGGVRGGGFKRGGLLSISHSAITMNLARGGNGGEGGAGGFALGASQPNADGQDAVGGTGGQGGAAGAARGGGIYNASGATLALTGAVISSNQALA